MEETRIYVIVAGTIQVPVSIIRHEGKVLPDFRKGLRTVVQPAGRQIAQACHVVAKLRGGQEFVPVTTIILQARDSAEMGHIYTLLHRRKLSPVIFSDTNESAYGPGEWPTAVSAFATPKQVRYVCDYLPLWGSNV